MKNKTHNLKIIQDDFRNESPITRESITEVEIATWLVKDGLCRERPGNC
jgi:hypothetical protein